MKAAFALRGKASLGKSQTIRTVIEMLTTNHPDGEFEHNDTTRVDVRLVLTINGWKIGVESQSDPNRTRASLDLFARMDCDVIICATRTKGATVDAVNALQGFDVHWLEQPAKSQPHEQILRSITMARKLVEKIEMLIASPKLARSLAATA